MPVDDRRTGTWVTYAGGRPTAIRVRRCRLEVVSGPDVGRACEIESSAIRIGARRGNDLQLSDSQVSGAHCEISLDEIGYRLRDLDSTNGTFVAGYRVTDVYLPPGALFQVGSSKLRFEPLEDSVELTLAEDEGAAGMVGRSVKMRELYARLHKVAPSDATVLITGETGVGKELVAEALHELSPRSAGPFVVLDCGSIPRTLIESELFGHEKGAFTGASSAHAGAFERADGGTLFLDEIGELPLDMQPKLLRALERKEVRRVGGAKLGSVDIRVVAATNRDLAVEVNRGRFREDLFYRLAVARMVVPPLRDRREDIPLLVRHFLESMPGAATSEVAPETLALMAKHDWPGNVRELRNVIERAVLLAEPPGSESPWGAAQARGGSQKQRPPSAAPEDAPERLRFDIDIETPYKIAKQTLLTEFERRYVIKLLAAHDGNISAAARAAGIDRMSIHKLLNRLGIENPGKS